MRISDWSSDVCSSDLVDQLVADRQAVIALRSPDDARRALDHPDLHQPTLTSATSWWLCLNSSSPSMRSGPRCSTVPRVSVICATWSPAFRSIPSATIIRTSWRMATFCPSTRRSEEHTSELQSLMRISYAVFCLKKKTKLYQHNTETT